MTISLNQLKTRQCNGCTLCCKLIGVKELDKKPNEWCTHCEIGQGCKIHNTPEQPQQCKDFKCLWLLGLWPEKWRPDKTKVVPWATKDGKSLVLYEDTPGQWRQFNDYLDRFKREGITIFIVSKDKRKLITGP